MHVFGPPVHCPLAGDRAYTPPEASVEELVAFQERLRVVRALLEANPERCVWGSDWPHPFNRGRRDPRTVQPFDPIDDVAALERLHGWVGDPALFRKIIVDNPARLYDF